MLSLALYSLGSYYYFFLISMLLFPPLSAWSGLTLYIIMFRDNLNAQ